MKVPLVDAVPFRIKKSMKSVMMHVSESLRQTLENFCMEARWEAIPRSGSVLIGPGVCGGLWHYCGLILALFSHPKLPRIV